ncbi:MAG TPA: hypothetical protein VNM14_18630 [Planctomycetota bacterium]|nr:hypothetical protein [Planctomycetota bacterium]
MGQEIVHCSVCGNRLRSSDFEKGDALRIDHTAYCRTCAPAGRSPDPLPPLAESTRKIPVGSATRIPIATPRRPTEAVSTGTPPILIWGGGGLVLAIAIAVMVLMTSSNERRADAPPVARAPEPERKEPRPRSPAPPAVAPAPATPAPVPAAKPASKPTSETTELAAIDAKIAATSNGREQEALLFLNEAKSRHDSLEWTAAIQRRINDLEKKLQPAAPLAAAPTPAPAPEPAPAPAPVPAAPEAPAPAAPAERSELVPFSPGAMKWSLLTPKKMSASSGSSLTALGDGSILLGGEVPLKDRYTLVLESDLKTITALRLELLTHSSLGATGPGRASNGNIVLSEFRVQVLSDPNAESGSPVAIERSAADFGQEGFPIAHTHDGKDDTGWALAPALGRPHEGAFEFKSAVTGSGPLTLLIVIDQQTIYDKHVIGRFRLSACSAKNAAQEIANRPPSAVDPRKVDQAIQRGIAWLRTAPYPADYWMGSNELVLWTFVHAGIPESDPDFQKRLKQMLDGPLERTYRVALQAMILEELDRVGYQQRIWQCAQFLVDNQCVNGQWHYGTPAELPKGVASPGKAPTPTAARLDADGHRIKPKVTRKLRAIKTRDGPADGDNSNSQYALLGLRACFDSGVQIPDETIQKSLKWWLESQYFDERKEGEYAAKGWSYTSPAKDPRAYHAMTAGGLSSIAICDYILGKDTKRAASKAGVNWIAQFWTMGAGYYYLYGLERAGILCGIEKFGRYAWYPLGAQAILDRQDASGAWLMEKPDPNKPDDITANNMYNTCFAILFLKRATRPLVASEDSKR